MSKISYRDFFAQCMPFIKMNYFCKILKINRQNLSSFIKYGNYSALSDDKCKQLYDLIVSTLENVA